MKYLFLLCALFLGACGELTPPAPTATVAPAVAEANGSFLLGRTGGIWRLDLPSQALTPIVELPTQEMAFDPALAPDDSHIAFSYLGPIPTPSAENPIVFPVTDLALADRDGSNRRILTPSPGPGISLLDPVWGPDGQTIYVTLETASREPNQPNRYSIASVDVASGNHTVLIDDASTPAVSPDGTMLIFIRQATAGTPKLMRYNVATKQESILVEDSRLTYLDSPTWTPDGSLVVFAANMQTPASSGLWDWLAVDTASAHGGNWAILQVPPQGGGTQMYLQPDQAMDDPQIVFQNESMFVWSFVGLYRYPLGNLNTKPELVYQPGDIGGIDRAPR